jgi:dynein heavy chain
MPKVFWLGGFTFPTGFLTSVKQTALKIILQTNANASIDKLGWEFGVTEAMEEREIGKVCFFLLLCCYVKNTLAEPEPMQLTCPMPIIHFKPCVIGEKKKSSKQMPQYPCPCYYYPVRTGTRETPSYMLEVFLNTVSNPQHWIKRGTALLMNLAT